MNIAAADRNAQRTASTPSRRTLHVELLRLCARIGYSPPSRRDDRPGIGRTGSRSG